LQSVLLVEPMFSVVFPLLQAVQEVWLSMLWYRPMGHIKHMSELLS
jgi:hypothetical protein